jgi:polyisoprenoid-binding protein YceI
LPENTHLAPPPDSAKETATIGPKSVGYALDTGVSRLTVRAFASGMLSAFGHSPTFAVRQYSGTLQLYPETLERASLQLAIKSASLEVADTVSDKDRHDIEDEMRKRVLETDRYPEILYECSKVAAIKTGDNQYSVTLSGDLTLHGVTHGQKVTAKVAVTGDVLRAFGECSLRQSDYNIKLVSAMGGGLKVKDEVKLSFDLVARKQP